MKSKYQDYLRFSHDVASQLNVFDVVSLKGIKNLGLPGFVSHHREELIVVVVVSRHWKYHLFFDIISYHIICQKNDIISFISYH
jgi:hypothetical protein